MTKVVKKFPLNKCPLCETYVTQRIKVELEVVEEEELLILSIEAAGYRDYDSPKGETVPGVRFRLAA